MYYGRAGSSCPSTAASGRGCVASLALKFPRGSGQAVLCDFPGYQLSLRMLDSTPRTVLDTDVQLYPFSVPFNLLPISEACSAVVPWDTARLVQRLSPVHLETYEASIAKFLARKWWVRVADKPYGVNGLLASVFPAAPTDEKTTKVRPVTDEQPCFVLFQLATLPSGGSHVASRGAPTRVLGLPS